MERRRRKGKQGWEENCTEKGEKVEEQQRKARRNVYFWTFVMAPFCPFHNYIITYSFTRRNLYCVQTTSYAKEWHKQLKQEGSFLRKMYSTVQELAACIYGTVRSE